MDAITKQRIAALWPELARRWVKVDDKLVSMGITVRVDQGLRTWSEQDALYAQGRTAPGPIVTDAKGGESWHNYGLALDFVPMLNGHPQWNRAFPWYAITIGIAEGWGFISGSKWANPDFPHLQITAPFPEAEPDDYCKALWHGGGDAAVWAEMNKYRSIYAAS
jgi:peptidoglycan L-alanyl-D-glutamate endopeptidase CwlK